MIRSTKEFPHPGNSLIYRSNQIYFFLYANEFTSCFLKLKNFISQAEILLIVQHVYCIIAQTHCWHVLSHMKYVIGLNGKCEAIQEPIFYFHFFYRKFLNNALSAAGKVANSKYTGHLLDRKSSAALISDLKVIIPLRFYFFDG